MACERRRSKERSVKTGYVQSRRPINLCFSVCEKTARNLNAFIDQIISCAEAATQKTTRRQHVYQVVAQHQRQQLSAYCRSHPTCCRHLPLQLLAYRICHSPTPFGTTSLKANTLPDVESDIASHLFDCRTTLQVCIWAGTTASALSYLA